MINTLILFAFITLIGFTLFLIYKILFGKGLTKWFYLPFMYVDLFILYVLIRFQIFKLAFIPLGFFQDFSVSASIDELSTSFFLIFQFGLILSIIPLIIFSIRLPLKYKNANKNFDISSAVETSSNLINIKDTRIKINRDRVFELTFQINDEYGTTEIIKKETLIPIAFIQYFTLNNSYKIYRSKVSANDFYIDIMGTMF